VIAFWILAVLMIASAVFTVTASKPVYSVVGLLVNFICLAALYLELQAEFLAVIQIVVYSGAILILFVFVIALLSSGVRPFVVGPNRAPYVLYPAIVLAALALIAIALTALRTPVQVVTRQTAAGAGGTAFGVTGGANAFGSVGDFGVALFTTNLLPFEVTAFILMVAVIGVVLIAGDEDPVTGVTRKRRRPGRREPIVKEPNAALSLSKGEQKS
jgi:NADH-quinone oxidoreductase subunit J